MRHASEVMTTLGILERELRGDVISLADPEYPKIAALITEAQQILAEMNTGYRDPAAMRALFSRLTGRRWIVLAHAAVLYRLREEHPRRAQRLRQSRLRVYGPGWYHHWRRRIDRPKVNLVTINHLLDPAQRRSTWCAPIVIKRGAWLGASVSVMPGVTIGENAVVAANAVVIRHVLDNTVVGGIPERVIKNF